MEQEFWSSCRIGDAYRAGGKPDDKKVEGKLIIGLLLLGSDDGIKVWLNGKLVHSNNTLRGMSPAQDIVQVNLKAGWNSVLVKVTEAIGGWGFYFDIADLGGKPLADVIFDTKKSR